MLSLTAATTSAERFAFLPLGDLLTADRAPWMECLKAFLAATQLLEHDDAAGALSILEALTQAPLLRYLTWVTSADPEPLLRFSNEQAFITETVEAIDFQKKELFQAAANDLGAGIIGEHQIQQYWREHGSLVESTFLRLCTLAARAAREMKENDAREQWCHRGLMATVIFGMPLTGELIELAEGDEWRVVEMPVALRFAKRWREITGPNMRLSQA